MTLRCPGGILVIQGKIIYEGFLLFGFSGTCALVHGTAFDTGESYKPEFPVHAEKHSLTLLHSKNKSLNLS